MKDLSLFLLKNHLASKMKKGFRNFCHGVSSTSTLKQKPEADVSCVAAPSIVGSFVEESNAAASPLTLEQMILQLDMEEEAARRRERVDDYSELHRRMSCVNNSDILRSARNALSQYPRFSLDGKDAMYRSSFCNFGGRPSNFEGNCGGRRSACCCNKFLSASCRPGYQLDLERNLCLPPTVAGESVVWCKPGVVAKLMGLDAVPVPVGGGGGGRGGKRPSNASASRKVQCLRRNGRFDLEKEKVSMTLHGCKGGMERESSGSCSGYCMLNPIAR
ncbi:hypothetical protein Cni_G25139 [Canna indica]|uniref:DUF3741 domain-containing protein n=1 Tax=Canna indica TaxID=4628 RepID=A0AAQ3L3S6_9LILI|nr:hypothetical protein Cni_G25139 [Canna indica]